MPPGSGPRLQHALLYLFVLTYIVAAQQQQPNIHRHSPPENVAVDSSTGRRNHHYNVEQIHKKGKDTAAVHSSNERALATFAPDGELVPSVRARPARPSGASSGLSRHSARSLQDWQVEDIILLATVDGKIYARERNTGAPRWELEVDHPMVQTTYHKNNRSVEDVPAEDDFLWIVEPSQDGALYVYSPDSRMGMQRLGLTVKQLVEELSPYAGEDPPVVYTAEKKNTLYTIDAADGNIIKMFSSAGSVSNTDRSCRKVNALESLEDKECEPMGTLTLGRTEYIVGIQDKESGDPICTISYFEWGPNNRDRDLQSQYSTTLDNRYVYSKHDGSVMALEHNREGHGRRRGTGSQSLMYSHKFSSPVARVYDVVRPHLEESEATDASLVVLPQPVGPVNKEWPVSDNVFVNCTEGGSWYALSEQSYPLVTDGASRALCYTDDIYMPHVSLGPNVLEKHRTRLVGLHPLAALDAGSSHLPTIGGPEPQSPVVPPQQSPAEKNRISDDYTSTNWSSSLPSPVTVIFLAIFTLTAIPGALPTAQGYMHQFLKKVKSGKEPSHEPTQAFADATPEVVDVRPSVEVEKVEVPSEEPEEHKVRYPEPAEEIIFPTDSNSDSDAKVESNEPAERAARESSPESGPDPSVTPAVPDTPATPKAKPNGVEASPVKPEKKARRGVRGGRKLKEKKLEQEQAQQRRRANSQSKRNSISQELTKIAEEGPATPKPTPQILTPQISTPPVISVETSESPNVHGKIRINNLIINTDRLIGNGSAGTCVYEGTFGKRDVAVKRMLSQYYELASQEVVFLQENDDHPNVIRYYCQERDQNFLYIAVELCQGSLWDVFNPHLCESGHKREQFSEVLQAIQLDVPKALYQIVLGLKHLHARRIIHRDIKPQNILIGRPTATNKGPHLLISDFGLCKTLPDNASTVADATVNAGTCGWKAPELISQPKDTASLNGHSSTSTSDGTSGNPGGVKRAADIFSLGCLFFWVLTGGCHPFDDKEGWAQIRELNIKKNNMQNMHKLDLGSDTEEPMQLITAMLAHRPEERPNVNDILEHPFFWKPKDRLAFLCDVSDHFEREPREPPSEQLNVLESYGEIVIPKGDFLKILPREFVDTLGKQRKYTGSKMLDLLRALRNKRNHYEDMPDEVKRRVGPLPGGYLNFWTARFPKLLMACYWIVRECGLMDTERFKGYFEVKE
ncbi:ribonuclease-like protein 1 [Elsinoe australis]|uniref:non-specific serine/threonine protein kinase n=1 Tax=Elsinoe australis TaxID=40998 RepID=A0A4U7BCV7_9PEZI|nr:ribonuclease-like protein 1 [Elsinoe australis]